MIRNQEKRSKNNFSRTFPSSILTQARMDFLVAQTSSIKSLCVLQAYLVDLMNLVQNVVVDVSVQQVVGGTTNTEKLRAQETQTDVQGTTKTFVS